MGEISYGQFYDNYDVETSLENTPAIKKTGAELSILVEENPESSLVLTFYGATTRDATYVPYKRRTSSDTDFTSFETCTLTIGTTAGIYPIPVEIAMSPYHWLKIVSNVGSTIFLSQLGQARVLEVDRNN